MSTSHSTPDGFLVAIYDHHVSQFGPGYEELSDFESEQFAQTFRGHNVDFARQLASQGLVNVTIRTGPAGGEGQVQEFVQSLRLTAEGFSKAGALT